MATTRSIPQIYAQIKERNPGKAMRELSPSQIAFHIPEGGDPATWHKLLRNHEYNLNHPKPKRRRISTAGKPHKRFNYAASLVNLEAATRTILFTANGSTRVLEVSNV